MAGREDFVNPKAFERQRTLRIRSPHLIISSIRIALFVFIIFQVFPELTSAAGITFVQVNSAVPQTPQTSVTVKYTKAQTAGDLNVVVVGWNDSTSQISSVADSAGNTYSLAVGPAVQTGTATQAIYYAKNIVSAAANANTVTVTFNTAAKSADIRIAEYAGLDLANPVDVAVAGQGSSATSSSGSVTTSNANDLLVGANLVQSTTKSAGTGYTKRVITSQDGDILEDSIVTTTGSYSATASLASSSQWIMQMVAFRAASSGVGPPSKLAFTVQPTNVVAGAAITPAVAVTIEDASGNPVTTATNAVTMAIGTNPSSGTLTGTLTVNAVAGVATFANLSISAAGSGYTLAASATGLTGATSNAFNVTAGTASKLAFTVQPTNVVGGAAITPAVAVTIEGRFGNPVTTATNAVTMAIGTNPSSGTLAGTLTVNAVGVWPRSRTSASTRRAVATRWRRVPPG